MLSNGDAKLITDYLEKLKVAVRGKDAPPVFKHTSD